MPSLFCEPRNRIQSHTIAKELVMQTDTRVRDRRAQMLFDLYLGNPPPHIMNSLGGGGAGGAGGSLRGSAAAIGATSAMVPRLSGGAAMLAEEQRPCTGLSRPASVPSIPSARVILGVPPPVGTSVPTCAVPESLSAGVACRIWLPGKRPPGGLDERYQPG
mmetsp:Transcript_125868/g.317313  ORF Transcript_125868/g.317313 Transcript_125868/m.317313 type:complete len:161 (+) Transcript_125868:117-599(+)